MHETFVKNAQHDIDYKQGRENEHRLRGERRLKFLRRALERGLHGVRLADLGSRLLDSADSLAERYARREIERQGNRRKLTLMIDGDRSLHGLEGRKLADRDQPSAGRMHVD